jgi:outer membrane murein-binding lipoprotein Lpp
MLEQKLQEELNRYKAINKYGKTMIMEQEAAPAEPTPEDSSSDAELPATDASVDGGLPPLDTASTDAELPAIDGDEDNTEEIDITDLVNMTKNIKNDLENNKQDNNSVIGKMDDVFTKLTDLESKLAQMDAVMSKIDQLGSKVEQMRPKTEVEKLEMRSLDSYPFNEKPQEFFAHKQGEMRASGKNEYVLTKDEVTNYPTDTIKQSFNPEEETQNEYRF